MVRTWRVLLLLRAGPKTLEQLASALSVTTRNVWALGETPAWPRRESTPIGEAAAEGAR